MGRLSGRVALVTGAGRGIGAALAAKLAAEGAHLVLNDLDEEPLTEAARALEAQGARVHPCPGSVSDPEFPRRFVGAALERFGGVDIVVNNAGYVWNSPIGKITDEQWDAMHDVHVRAPFRLLRELAPYLKSRHAEESAAGQRVQRKVVNVSSIAATQGTAAQAAYSAAKAGLSGLTRTLAKEWGPLGVNVNCVAFGLIETRLTQEIKGETAIEVAGKRHRVGLLPEMLQEVKARIPLRRAGTVDEAAGALLLFCLPESDYITGQVIEVDGGGIG
jgi:3-oxoacyl-[acyl-carrier protein] reductase